MRGDFDANRVYAPPSRQQPVPAKVDPQNELLAIRSNPHGYRDPAASDGQQPILTRWRVAVHALDASYQLTPSCCASRRSTSSASARVASRFTRAAARAALFVSPW